MPLPFDYTEEFTLPCCSRELCSIDDQYGIGTDKEGIPYCADNYIYALESASLYCRADEFDKLPGFWTTQSEQWCKQVIACFEKQVSDRDHIKSKIKYDIVKHNTAFDNKDIIELYPGMNSTGDVVQYSVRFTLLNNTDKDFSVIEMGLLNLHNAFIKYPLKAKNRYSIEGPYINPLVEDMIDFFF
jgi:hypothetical protein